MQALRVAPPRTLGGEAVEWAEDLLSAGAAGVGTRADKERVAGLPAADLLIYGTAENSRLVIRPSGTEPRIKIHMQARVQAPNGDVGSARRLATVRLDALEADMRQLLGAAARGRPRC
jgi:phosphomannomutase